MHLYATSTFPIFYAPYLPPPPNFAEALFSISLVMTVILRRNEKQRLIYTKFEGGGAN